MRPDPPTIYTGCLHPGCCEQAVQFYCIDHSIALITEGNARRRAVGQNTVAEDLRIAQLLRMKEAA